MNRPENRQNFINRNTLQFKRSIKPKCLPPTDKIQRMIDHTETRDEPSLPLIVRKMFDIRMPIE